MAQINKPSNYFNTVTYTGDGTSPRSITGVGFQPDFLWIKDRSTAYEHRLMDAVRGSNKVLFSSASGAELSEEYYTVSSFDSDGWTGRSGTGTNQVITGGNDNGDNFVAWNWLASNTTASNTDGSITSTVSANTTSGFSIVSYTGNSTGSATFGHGLGSTPKIVIIKCRSLGTESWQFWFNNTSRLNLNSTVASLTTHPISTNSTLVTTPSSSNDSWNTSGQTYIAYCFAEKKGFSKFGSYTGNGSTDGTFVYTGFKPAFVIYKKSSALGTDWIMVDNKRNTFNVLNKELYANVSASEGTVDLLDFTSNGFKCRRSHTSQNESGQTYIYMAFAESPLVGTNNIPATAR